MALRRPQRPRSSAGHATAGLHRLRASSTGRCTRSASHDERATKLEASPNAAPLRARWCARARLSQGPTGTANFCGARDTRGASAPRAPHVAPHRLVEGAVDRRTSGSGSLARPGFVLCTRCGAPVRVHENDARLRLPALLRTRRSAAPWRRCSAGSSTRKDLALARSERSMLTRRLATSPSCRRAAMCLATVHLSRRSETTVCPTRAR